MGQASHGNYGRRMRGRYGQDLSTFPKGRGILLRSLKHCIFLGRANPLLGEQALTVPSWESFLKIPVLLTSNSITSQQTSDNLASHRSHLFPGNDCVECMIIQYPWSYFSHCKSMTWHSTDNFTSCINSIDVLITCYVHSLLSGKESNSL